MACTPEQSVCQQLTEELSNKYFELTDDVFEETPLTALQAEQLRSAAIQWLKNVRNLNTLSPEIYLEALKKHVKNRLTAYGLQTINDNDIEGLVTVNNYSYDESTRNTTTESLDKDLNSVFELEKVELTKIWLDVDSIRIPAMNEINVNLIRAILFDSTNGKYITTLEELNSSINDYKNRLYKVVFDYLKSEFKDENNKNKLLKYSVYDEITPNVWTPTKFKEIYLTARDYFLNYDKARLLRDKISNPLSIKAFNAFQTLLHFNEFVRNSFGNNVQISNFNEFGKEVYSLLDKATSMFWANDLDDDIDLSKSINNISKLIIESSPLYDWDHSSDPIDLSYLTFQQFISVITKLKDLSWSNVSDFNLFGSDEHGNAVDLSTVSDETKRYLEKLDRQYYKVKAANLESIIALSENKHAFEHTLKSGLSLEYIAAHIYNEKRIPNEIYMECIPYLKRNITLALVINDCMHNAKDSYSALFEILTNRGAISSSPIKEVLKNFNKEQKNVLLSLSQAIFLPSSQTSLYSLLKNLGYDSKINYFNYILQTANSTWLAKNSLYYQDFETKNAKLIALQSNNIDRALRQLNNIINTSNNINIRKDLTGKYLLSYVLSDGFYLTIPGFGRVLSSSHSAEIKVNLNSNPITLDSWIRSTDHYDMRKSILPFVDDVLLQNFLLNTKYYENFVSLFLSELDALKGLFEFAVEVLHGHYAASEIAKNHPTDLSAGRINEDITKYYNTEYYKTNMPKAKFEYGTIDFIPTKLVSTVLEPMAVAKVLSENGSTSNTAQDSLHKTVANSTPSRLLSTFLCQFEQIRKEPEAAAYHFDIIGNKRLFRDIQTVRDFKNSEGESKLYKDFSTKEFLQSALLYNFLNPIAGATSTGLADGNTIAFVEAVNSDKNTISNMIMDTQEIAHSMGYDDFEDLLFDTNGSNAIMHNIEVNMGLYYLKIIDNINSDLVKLSKSLYWQLVFGITTLNYYHPNTFGELNTKLLELNTNRSKLGLDALTMRLVFDIASKETGLAIREPLHVQFNSKTTVGVNPSLLLLYARFNSNVALLQQYKIPSLALFVQYKNSELLADLCKNNVVIDLLENEKLRELLNKRMPLWVDKAQNLILAKINIGGTIYTIKNRHDLLNLQKVFGIDNILTDPHILHKLGDFQLNPLLEKYNLLQYNYSLQMICATVGSHVNHPAKGAKAVNINNATFDEWIWDEAARFQALHKRNVSNTASMHEFHLNLLNGIPSNYNIAIMDDIKDLTFNIYGEVKDVSPFDGATFVNPFVVELENNSLNGERAGIHKKQFVHYYDEKTGTGGIIKTAGFGLTNSWMRNSPLLERIMQKMTDKKWLDLNGQPLTELNIVENTGYSYYYYEVVNGKPLYYKVESDGIEYLGNNNYRIHAIQCDKYGNSLNNENVHEVKAETNYLVWKNIFKGLNSCSLNNNGVLSRAGKWGESSIKNTVLAMNKTGILLEGDTPINLDNFYLPMKHSQVHYMPTIGAVKQGIANTNDVEQLFTDYDESKLETALNSFSVKMDLAGILLDKEHHADNSEISMMTLVISACAALGYTWDNSNKMYKALESLTMQGIKPITDSLKLPREVITDIILKQLANGSKKKDGVIYNIAYNLIQAYNQGKPIDLQENTIALSDSSVFNKLQSMVSSLLTKSAIKLKFSGILSVLVPSHEIMKLYGGKLKRQFLDFDSEIEKMQSPPVSISKVQIGRTYQIYNEEGLLIVNPDGSAINFVVKAPNMKGHNKFYGDLSYNYIGYYDLKKRYGNCQFVENLKVGRNLGAYHATIYSEDGTYSFYDIASSYNLYNGIGDEKTNRQALLEDLKNLKIGGQVIVKDNDGNDRTIHITGVDIVPYEIVMPKTFAEKLGLTEEDEVSDLAQDYTKFKNKLVDNLANRLDKESAYTFAFKKVNGHHIYVLDAGLYDSSLGLLEVNEFPKIVEDGEVWRLDSNGKKLHKLFSMQDKVYKLGNLEIIVTHRPEIYGELLDYNTIEISSNASKENITKLNKLSEESDDKNLKNYNKLLYTWDPKKRKLIDNSKDIVKNTKDLNNLDYFLEKEAKSLYNSFKQTLDIIAARIPAQSMLSFMPMKVVAYEDLDINTAYVSTHLIWLLGSDYDIDAVSLLTYELDNSGKFVGWSPYFRLDEDFNRSKNINFPTGNKLERVTNDNGMVAIALKWYENSDEEGYLPEEVVDNYYSDLFDDILESFDILNTFKEPKLRIKNFGKFVNLLNSLSELGGLIQFTGSRFSNAMFLKFAKKIEDLYSKPINEEIGNKILDKIAKMVDDHNTFTKNRTAPAFTKNFIVYLMHLIAMNPVNLMLAQTSVDSTTDVPKSIANELSNAYSKTEDILKRATPGNVANVYQSIEDNHVGKDVIGISAVGLKTFFALTLYMNTKLRNGDTSILTLKPIVFNGKSYYTIANLNYEGDNMEILRRLNTGNGQDAALMLSALLSLATDNAKELCLAKLNANAKLAGMYIYGLSMGIDFRELALLMVSPLGDVVSLLMQSNIVTGKRNYNTVDLVIQYLEDPVDNVVNDLINYRYNEKSIVYYKLNDAFSKFMNWKKHEMFENLENQNLETFLNYAVEQIKQNPAQAEVVNDLLDEFLVLNANLDPQLHQGFDMIRQMIDLVDLIYTYEKVRPNAIEDFKTLFSGAEEFKTLGLLLGANQGIKNSESDFIKWVNNIEAINDSRLKVRRLSDKFAKPQGPLFDIYDFVEKEDVRNRAIQSYESLKSTFNVLDVMTTVPHYFGYLKAIAHEDKLMKGCSIKYRTARANYFAIDQIIGKQDADTKIKRLNLMIDTRLVDTYLANKAVYIPNGCAVFAIDNNKLLKHAMLKSPIQVHLGTAGGNATFKYWMELFVIPDLKQGKLQHDGSKVVGYIRDNKFILSLSPNIYNNNPSMSNSIVMSSSVNMSPYTDEDMLALDELRIAFDSLNRNYTVLDANGLEHSIPIKDLFFMYNLVTYLGRRGSLPLTSIFDNYVNNPEALEYRLHIIDLDNSKSVLHFGSDEIILGTALFGSIYNSFNKAVFVKDKEALKVKLMQRTDDGFMPSPLNNNLDPNYFTRIPTDPDIIKHESSNGTLLFNTVSRNVVGLTYKDAAGNEVKVPAKEINMLNNSEFFKQYNPYTGEIELNKENIESYLQSKSC